MVIDTFFWPRRLETNSKQPFTNVISDVVLFSFFQRGNWPKIDTLLMHLGCSCAQIS